MTWLTMAVLSAIFAGLTSILAKCGIRKTEKATFGLCLMTVGTVGMAVWA